MGKIIERCAGLDIGKRFLLCCVMTGAAHEEPRSKTRRFDTTVARLELLRNWLNDEQVTDVVMESRGSYWIPVFNLLEGRVTVVLANPEEVKNRRGHKTDGKDAEHLADLLRHNHVRSSYIPAEPVRQLRDLTRRRVQLTQDATRERNRVQKLLEQVNVKIASVLTDVFGVSGLQMLLALLEGRAAPAEMAQLARGSAKRKIPQLIEAIEGNRMSNHARFLIRGCLRHLACLEEEVEELDAEILRRMQLTTFQKAFTLLQTIPGGANSRQRRSWQRQGQTWTPFRRLSRWRVGRGCVQGIGKVQAFRREHKPHTATLISVRPWCNVRGRQPVSATLSFGPAFNE